MTRECREASEGMDGRTESLAEMLTEVEANHERWAVALISGPERNFLEMKSHEWNLVTYAQLAVGMRWNPPPVIVQEDTLYSIQFRDSHHLHRTMIVEQHLSW